MKLLIYSSIVPNNPINTNQLFNKRIFIPIFKNNNRGIKTCLCKSQSIPLFELVIHYEKEINFLKTAGII